MHKGCSKTCCCPQAIKNYMLSKMKWKASRCGEKNKDFEKNLCKNCDCKKNQNQKIDLD